MFIGQVAKASGVSAKLIRYYESIGLINPASRNESGYRDYSPKEVQNLQFVRKARSLGFSIERIQQLKKLWNDESRASADVKKIASEHIIELQEKISEMQQMVDTLSELVNNCNGDTRPECPILSNLEQVIS